MAEAALITFQVVVAVAMLVGLVGLAFFLPGLTIIWAAALIYALVMGFTWKIGIIFAAMTVIMLVGNVVDNVIMGASARLTGASWLAIGVALVGGIAGTIFFPPLGGLLAALLGIFIVEAIRLRDWRKALESARSMAVGCGGSTIVRFGLGILMIALWVVWAFFLK